MSNILKFKIVSEIEFNVLEGKINHYLNLGFTIKKIIRDSRKIMILMVLDLRDKSSYNLFLPQFSDYIFEIYNEIAFTDENYNFYRLTRDNEENISIDDEVDKFIYDIIK